MVTSADWWEFRVETGGQATPLSRSDLGPRLQNFFSSSLTTRPNTTECICVALSKVANVRDLGPLIN
jgi:hypothetical protein